MPSIDRYMARLIALPLLSTLTIAAMLLVLPTLLMSLLWWMFSDLPGADAMEGVATLNLEGLTRLDTAGAWVLHDAQLRGVTLEALPAARRPLLDAVIAAWPTPDPPAPKSAAGWRQPVEAVGRAVAAAAGLMRSTSALPASISTPASA